MARIVASPLALLSAALILVCIVPAAHAYPARFANLLASDTHSITFLIESQSHSHSCSADYSTTCDLGDVTFMPNAQISATSNGKVIAFLSGNLTQTSGQTYVVYSNVTNGTVIGAVPDGVPVANDAVTATLGNFYPSELTSVSASSGLIYVMNMLSGDYDSDLLAAVPAGASAISFEVQSTGKAYTFNVQYTGNAAYTLLFYPSNTPGEAKLLSIFTGEVGSKTTAPPHHHHMWVPIVVALAVTAVVMSAAGIWYYIRRGRNAYQPI